MTKTNLNTAIVAHIGHSKTAAIQEAVYAQSQSIAKTIEEISKEEKSIKITATHQPKYFYNLSGQEKRRERRKKPQPKK